MNENEIMAKLDALAIEKRSFMASIENGTGAFDEAAANAKIADFEARKAELNKQLAECKKPVEKPVEKRGFGLIAETMQKRSAVTLNGTGTVNTVKELVKAITKNSDVLNLARYFYGADAGTNIPVWASHMSAEFVAEGGSVTAQSKSIAATSITPKQAMTSLPVSKMALDLSAADLEGELPDLFGAAFGDLMATQMMTGDGTNMQGVFTDAGTTAYTKGISVVDLAGLARTIRAKNYINPVLVMSPTVYAAFLADTSTDETTKLYKESLIRDKSIEDVKVVLSAYAPTAVSSGSKIVIGGDFNNYAIGVAGQLDIVPKQTAGASYVTFDASSYFSGKPVISADFYAYTVE